MLTIFAGAAGRSLLTENAHAATVEEIALMNRPDRQKILVEGAKKEGKVSWYTTLIVDQVVRPVKEAFEKEYPFIQVEYLSRQTGASSKNDLRVTKPNDMKRCGGRHGVTDHGATGRAARNASTRRCLPSIRQSSRMRKVTGAQPTLFFRHRLQHPYGQSRPRCRRLTKICSTHAGRGR